jgi:hypothetical protein
VAVHFNGASDLPSQVARLMRSFEQYDESSDSRREALLSFVFNGNGWIVKRESMPIGRTDKLWQAFRYLEWQLDIFLADTVSDQYLAHGGAVAINDAAMLLLGQSGSGKSSLTLGLVQQGATYYSDDIVVIDPAARLLHPFPKAFSLKNRALFPELARQGDLWLGPSTTEISGQPARSKAEQLVWFIHPEDVSPGCVAPKPAPVRFIVFPTYQPGAVPQLTPITPNQAMRRLLENSINFQRLPGGGLALLSQLARNATSFTLTAGDLSTTVALLHGLF